MVASPLHKLDCCLVTDGAGAFVVTSAERAEDLRKPPVYVLGAATAHDHMMISQMPDLATTPGAISGPKAFAMAGIKPSDVDVFMGYDSFTITQLLHFEDLGFCAKGEGGAFVESTNIGPGRRAADQHQRRRARLHPPRHVRHVPPRRGGAPAARRVRRPPGARRRGRRRPRLGHGPVVHVDRRPRHGGDAVMAPLRTEPHRSRTDDVLGRHPRRQLPRAVVHRVRRADLLSPRGVPAVPVGRHARRGASRAAQATVLRGERAAPARQPARWPTASRTPSRSSKSDAGDDGRTDSL